MTVFESFVRNRIALIGMVFIVVVCLFSLIAPLVLEYSYFEQDFESILLSPSFGHLMGTDSLGRDLFARVMYGSRMSIMIGIVTAIIAFLFGAFYGAVSGYLGGRVDSLMMRIVDVFYIFPSLLIVILATMVFGRGIIGILFALGLVSWVNIARLVRGQVLQLKETLYIEASRSMGAGMGYIVLRHIIPNVLGPVLVAITYQIPQNIMAESFLSFIGLGLKPPFSSWGTLANEGWRAYSTYPHLIVFPGLVLFITVMAFNFIGDGLRDAFDPRSGRKN